MCTPFGIGIGVGTPNTASKSSVPQQPKPPVPQRPKSRVPQQSDTPIPDTPIPHTPEKAYNNQDKKVCDSNHSCSCNNADKTKSNIGVRKPSTLLAYGATNKYINNSGEYVINVLLPGFTKENISVSYAGKVLTIEALYVSNVEFSPEKILVKTVGEEFRGAEHVKREFVLNNALFENATMTLENGILTIVVPCKQEDAPKKISFTD
jgi:HSP20 family molecular chaperone IbpA